MPVQVPTAAVSVWPSRAVPAIFGEAVFFGPTPAAVTTSVATDVAAADPESFFAVTTTRSRWPTS